VVSQVEKGRVLVDLLPNRTARLLAVPLGAALIGAAAQLSITTGMATQPITGTTVAVLLVAAVLGMVRGSLAVALYCVAGLLGVPWFPGASSEMASSSYGYAIGFVLAAALVGWLAQRGWSRNPLDTALAFLLGDVLIFATGVAWFAVTTGNSWSTAVAVGMSPFLLGEVIKIGLAAIVLPLTWRLAERTGNDNEETEEQVDLRAQPGDGDSGELTDQPSIDLRSDSPTATAGQPRPPQG